MKKISIVSTFAFGFLAVASVVAYFLRFLGGDVWLPLICGVLLLVISGLLAFFAKKSIAFNAVCSAISAVALGFLIRAWYINRGFDNPLWMMLLVSLGAIGYLWIFFLLSRIPIFKAHPIAFAVPFVVLSAIGYAIFVFTTVTTFVSTFGYYMLVVIAFIFAMCKSTAEPRDLVRAMTLSTYSLFAVAVIIAVFIALGDGDFDLDLDFDLDFGDGEGIAEIAADALDATTGATDPQKKNNPK